MTYFSRLTDIVSCNLTEILEREAEPQQAIEKIIAEMEEGLAGAKRSAATAASSQDRISHELEEHRSQIERWTAKAKEELQARQEDQARLALFRKHEVEDVVAGMEQQYQAAVATREHLTTMQRALEARLSEAARKAHALASGTSSEESSESMETAAVTSPPAADETRNRQIDDELAALKRELNQSS